MAQPKFLSAATAHINQHLSNYASGYKSDEFFWKDLAPKTPVSKLSDDYYQFQDDEFDIDDMIGGDVSEFDEINFEIADTSYAMKRFKGQTFLPDDEAKNADEILQDRETRTRKLVSRFQRKLENDVIGVITTSGNYTTSTDRTAAQWTTTNRNFIDDAALAADNMIKARGVQPNLFAMSKDVWNVLRQNEKMAGFVTYGLAQTAIFTPDQVGKFLQIDRVRIPISIKTTSADGVLPRTKAFIWSAKSAAFLYNEDSPRREDPSFAKTFMWNTPGYGEFEVYTVPDPIREGTLIRVKAAWQVKVTASDAGHLFYNVVA